MKEKLGASNSALLKGMNFSAVAGDDRKMTFEEFKTALVAARLSAWKHFGNTIVSRVGALADNCRSSLWSAACSRRIPGHPSSCFSFNVERTVLN